MNKDQIETLVTWLKDAYAMEQGIAEVLERQVGQMDDMPEAQEKMQEHLELTKTHAEQIKQCVERLGEDVSRVKSGIASVLGAVQGMSTVMAKDKMLKNAMANYAIEYFEIACYLANAEAARMLGYDDIAEVCESIIEEEQEMADWLEEQIAFIARHELNEAVESE